mmetsp:Transcript_29765/g.54662  ORF Transcript_29765/g.54662 Transcript_29765/m.54662 type:complete len:103 (+) Transcript_29765:1603-1911(+)
MAEKMDKQPKKGSLHFSATILVPQSNDTDPKSNLKSTSHFTAPELRACAAVKALAKALVKVKKYLATSGSRSDKDGGSSLTDSRERSISTICVASVRSADRS